jgi:hypothetical protein
MAESEGKEETNTLKKKCEILISLKLSNNGTIGM